MNERKHTYAPGLRDASAREKDINLPNSEGYTLLHQAAIADNTTEIMYLLRKGAKIDISYTQFYKSTIITGRTPIHLAAIKGSVDAIIMLGYNNADIVTNSTETKDNIVLLSTNPLHLAAIHNKQGSTIALLDVAETRFGINSESFAKYLEITNSNKRTALEEAVYRGHAGVALILKRAGASMERVKGELNVRLLSALDTDLNILANRELAIFWVKCGAEIPLDMEYESIETKDFINSMNSLINKNKLCTLSS